MALALQAKQRLSCRCARRTIECRAGAAPQKQLQLAVATAAAASLLAAPAFAGVILAKPELKRVFVDDAPAPVKTTASAPAPKAAPAPKVEAAAESGEGFSLSPYTVALPGALVLVAGGGAFALKTDPEFLNRGLLKDSNVLGAGYEEILKSGNAAALSVGKTKAGTKLFKKK